MRRGHGKPTGKAPAPGGSAKREPYEASSQSGVVAAAYLRVSTDDQAREGFSLDAQRERIRAYCVALGYTLLKEFVDDGFSGRTTNRPNFQALMEAVRNGLLVNGSIVRLEAVIVARFDRLNRNLYDFLATQREMQRYKVHFASVVETVDTRGQFGQFFLQVIGAFAELESKIIGERVHAGMREKALQAGFNGMSSPYGFDVRDGGLVVKEKEAVVIRRICWWRQRGRSLVWIANRLNDEGIPTKKGKRWSKRQVHRVVHNPLYRGALHWEDIVTPGTHQAIVKWTPRKRKAGRRKS